MLGSGLYIGPYQTETPMHVRAALLALGCLCSLPAVLAQNFAVSTEELDTLEVIPCPPGFYCATGLDPEPCPEGSQHEIYHDGADGFAVCSSSPQEEEEDDTNLLLVGVSVLLPLDAQTPSWDNLFWDFNVTLQVSRLCFFLWGRGLIQASSRPGMFDPDRRFKRVLQPGCG